MKKFLLVILFVCFASTCFAGGSKLSKDISIIKKDSSSKIYSFTGDRESVYDLKERVKFLLGVLSEEQKNILQLENSLDIVASELKREIESLDPPVFDGWEFLRGCCVGFVLGSILK